LIHRTDNRAMPGAWLSLAAAIALIAIWLSRARQTAGRAQSLKFPANHQSGGDSVSV